MKVLYASMERLLSSAERMPADFLRDTVEAIAPVTMGGTADERHILVVDEYETLFGMLNGQLCAHPDSKYTQVKPMLDQLVAFSQNNLLILVGMWPDAHYMMMEQNHLSMHVEQDGFPLFFHQSGSTTSEFAELVRRAVSRLEFDAEFCDALYAETAGHPFLTVLLLRHMLDWLIQERFRPGLTPLGRDLFATFAADKLGSRSIALNPHYASYMQVVSGALSVQGLKHTPWVYAVHRIMQAVARKFGPSGACGLDDYESLWDSLELDSTGLDRFEVLRSASLSNFLRLQDDQLSVAIPLLARIADGCRC